MTVDKAQQLLERTISDTDFRERLESASQEERRELLEAEGFGDVKLKHLSSVLPDSHGGELSEEEFAAVAGGSNTLTDVTIAAGSGAGGGAVSASISIAAIAAL